MIMINASSTELFMQFIKLYQEENFYCLNKCFLISFQTGVHPHFFKNEYFKEMRKFKNFVLARLFLML